MCFHAALTEDATWLITSLAQDPEAFRQYYHTFACSIVLAVTYDRPLRGSVEDDMLRSRIEAFVARAQETTRPGAYYVELFPLMRYLPQWMARWKRDALHTYRETMSFFLELMEDVETRLVELYPCVILCLADRMELQNRGMLRPCLMGTMIQDMDRFQLSRVETAWAAGFM